MGRKKGSKNKQTQNLSVEAPSITQSDVSVMETKGNLTDPPSEGGGSLASGGPTPVQAGSDLGDNNRAAIYEQYYKTQEHEVSVEPGSEPFSEIKEDGGSTEETNTETPPEEGVTGAEYKAAEDEGSKNEEEVNEQKGKESDVKVVPYDALHAEREKRKSIQSQLDEVLQNYKKLEEASKQTSSEDDQLDYYDDDSSPSFKKLQHENKELKDAIVRIESRFIENDQAEFSRKISTDVESADKVLSEQGFPGFKDFGQNLVVQRLNEISAEKGEEEAQIYRNPEGWGIIWKELFPKVNSVFSGSNRSESFAQKKALKTGATLAGSPGQAPKEEKKSEEWTYDDYLKSRAASAA